MKTVYIAAPNTAHAEASAAAEQIEDSGAAGVVSGWHESWKPHHAYGEATAALLEAEAEHDLLDLSFASHLLVLENQNDSASRGGRHTELGFALARHLAVAIVGERSNVFHYLPDVRAFGSVEEYIAGLKTEPEPGEGSPMFNS